MYVSQCSRATPTPPDQPPASADRRPVDPPPIVELKIFDGDVAPENDITFAMNATYFLFATLEQARPMAHGRVPEDKTRHPVLTGTSVTGMVYYERPEPAGYFIFPDLSVRHEGKYRLSFDLYEEVKKPKDFDEGEDASKPAAAGAAHVTHRLEVKSAPFTVFSAKKFPGLTESTSLSRMFAEQGCRVRIRRDVRMRRRDQKSSKDWDEYEADTAQARARMSSTPESSQYAPLSGANGYAEPSGRPRSSSNASLHSMAMLSRRTSLQDINQTSQQPYSALPHTPRNGFSQLPYVQAMQPPPQQQAPSYAQPSVQNGYYPYATPSQAASASGPLQHQSHFASHPSYTGEQRLSTDYGSQNLQHDTRPPLQYPPSLQQPAASYHAPPQQSYQAPPLTARNSFSAFTPSYSQQEYSRPQPLQPPTRAVGATTPLSSRTPIHNVLAPLQIPEISHAKLEASSPASSLLQGAYFPSAVDSTQKRSYANVFSDRQLQQPLRDGARPAAANGHDITLTSGQYAAADVDDNSSDYDPSLLMRGRMNYRRADGSSAARCLPQAF